MRYSLLSRFRGALLGAVLGEALGRSWPDSSASSSALPPSLAVEEMLDYTCDRLIAHGRLDADALEPIAAELTEPIQMMAASLPVILFFHEQPHRLQQQLTVLIQHSPSSDLGDAIELMAAAIAHILQERRLLPQLSNLASGCSQPSPERLAFLEQVQSLLGQEASLEQAVRQLGLAQKSPPLGALALALYCLLSTPEDFPLTMIRALRAASYPAFAGLLAGGLAGAYGARAGIPPEWQLRYAQTAAGFKRADQLLAAWSGMYRIARPEPETPLRAVAAPGLIRPR